MDGKKYKAERQWIRNQLSNVADFWPKNGWDHEYGGVSTAPLRSIPLTRASGCRAAAAGPMPTCATSTALPMSGEHLLRTRRAYDIYWNLNHGMTAPTGMGPKSPHTGRALGIPMINK